LPKTLSLVQQQQQQQQQLVYDTEDYVDESTSDSSQQPQQPQTPPMIVLNYNTIAICILVLIVLIAVFSIIFAFLINRVQSSSSKPASIVGSNKNLTITTPVSHLNASINCQQQQKQSPNHHHQHHHHHHLHPNSRLRRLVKSIKRKFFKLVSHANEAFTLATHRRRFRRQNHANNATDMLDLEYKLGKSNRKVLMINDFSSTQNHRHHHLHHQEQQQHLYDLFLVYNKIDAELVHKIIAPILRSEPYNFKIFLEHDEENYCAGDSNMGTSLILHNFFKLTYSNAFFFRFPDNQIIQLSQHYLFYYH
jgi:hypothetical protein